MIQADGEGGSPWPIAVGGGTPWLPSGLRVRLELFQERRFAAGTVYLRYGVRGDRGLDGSPSRE